MVIILALRLIIRGGSKANLYQHLRLKHPTEQFTELREVIYSGPPQNGGQTNTTAVIAVCAIPGAGRPRTRAQTQVKTYRFFCQGLLIH